MCADLPLSGATHLDDDACLDFASGLLGEDRVRSALAHSAHCPACEERLRTSLAAHERGRARLAGALTAAVHDPARITPMPAAARGMRLPAPAWFAAAGLVAVIGAAWLVAGGLLPAPPRPVPAAVRLPALGGTEQTRNRSTASGDSLVFAGLAAYDRGELEAAAELLASARVENGLDRMRRVYLASAQLELGSPALALESLAGLRALDVPEPWRGEMEWNRFVALEKLGRRASADSLLEVLGLGFGPVSDRARALRQGRRPAR